MTDATTIPAAVLDTVQRRADALAVVDGATRLTYAGLGQRIVAATRAMMAAGVGPGDRVAVWAPNGIGWIEAALGAQCAGAALVPINTRWKGAEAAHVLAATKARVLATSIGFLGTDTVAMLAAVETPLPQLQGVVLLDGSDQPSDHSMPIAPWSKFLAEGKSVSDDDAAERHRAVQPHDISDILFTSGTTGRPKGVLMNHGQTVRQFEGWCDFAGLLPDDRYLIVNPFFHMFGYKAGWLAAFLRGAAIFPMAIFDVDAVFEMVEREAITVLPGAPTVYRSLLDHPDLDERELGTLRVAVTGAADIPVSLIEEMRARLPFSTILTGYGLTEAGTCTGSSPSDDAATIATTAGRAMPGLEIVISDANGRELPPGETGELLVRGYSVTQGYLDDPDATAAAIDEQGYLHTGDLATMDDRRYVRIVGRLKDMVIVGGFNVYPAEVENVMVEHPAIGEVAVIGIPDRRLGEVPVAFVVPAPASTPDAEEIISWSRERMANYKVPRQVIPIDALPQNATGKVMKEELRAWRDSNPRPSDP